MEVSVTDDDEDEEDDEEEGDSGSKESTVIDVWYGTGHISGHLGFDDIQVAGLKIEQQIIADATILSSDFSGTPFDGIFGLGLAGLSSSAPHSPPFYSMIEQGVVDNPLFAIYTQAESGEIDFGAIDKARFTGDIHYVDVTDTKYWMIDMDGAKLGQQTIGPRRAIVDSGKPENR